MVNTLFFIRRLRHLHGLLVWPALAALVIFVLSGFMHILLTWTGPQSTVTRPPSLTVDAASLPMLPAILKKHRITDATIIKLLPSAQGVLLQVTQDPKTPRRYFDLHSGDELVGYDEWQARWLADYYLASSQRDAARNIKSISLQTEFDNDYPWVNRLLPVYKVVYDDESGLTLYLHTEALALAAISNHWKQGVQTLFRQFHSWQWLNDFPQPRILVMLLLLSSLFAMLVMGISLLLLLRRRQVADLRRRWHRILAYVVCMPLLGFVASGTYHLLYGEYVATVRDFNLSQPLLLQKLFFDKSTVNKNLLVDAALLPTQSVNSVALLQIGEQLFYRISVADAPVAGGGEHDHHHSTHSVRNRRFDGVSAEQGAVYIAATGDAQPTALNDETVARRLAMAYLGLGPGKIIAAKKITRFGPDYDFRNKRLPVWRVDMANQETLFIDVASGLLVDRVNRAARWEAYSFSFLHKWNFLTALTGRELRDTCVVLVLSLALLLAALGVVLRLKTRPEAV